MKDWLFDLINGVRSGIPLCCVWYYLRWDDSQGLCAKTTGLRRGTWGQYIREYVACDTCHETGKIVKIKKNGVIMKWLIE